MANSLRQFEPAAAWCNPDLTPTPRAQGWMRSFSDFVGAGAGVIPISALGGDGVSTNAFLREDGTFAIPSYPAGANPTGQIGTAAVNGVATTFMRSDAAPPLNLGITPTWTGLHTFSNGISATSGTFSATMQVGTSFGCNGATPQASAVVSAAVAGTAGAAYTATEQGIINNLVTLVNQLRAALVANGIAV